MTLAPRQPRNTADVTLHFVECRYSRETAFVERDPNESDLTTTVWDIAAGQIENPVRVLAVNVGEGTARDVTDDVKQAVADLAVRERLSLPQKVLEWISDEIGMPAAYRLGLEAA